MDIYAVRQELRTKSIYDMPLRVTFYARVSTDSDDQKNSLENQQKYYTDFITGNSNWIFVPGYIDEGISGISTRKRESFLSMIDDAKEGKFDFIVTKELSRFARNTLDSIKYTRDLLSCGVCVLFQNDGINTIDEDSELRLTIRAGIAQDELRKLSSRVKFGHQQAIRNGVVIGNSRIFGYMKKDKRLVIDEEEAPMVRELFALYATDRYSLKQLENLLYEKGYRNHNGKAISHTTLSNILSNPKYKGFYVGNKVKVVDLFTKKQKFLPQDQWVMYKDETGETGPAIVSEELWNKANAVLERRSADVKKRQNKCTHANLLTGKLVCAHCGTPYYRKDATYKGKSTSRWVCSGKLKNGYASCNSFAINESDIKALIFSAFTGSYRDAERYIDEYLAMYKSKCASGPVDTISESESIIESAGRRKEKLLQYNADGKISDEDFLRMYASCEEEIRSAKESIEKAKSEQSEMTSIEKELKEIKRVITESVKDIDHNADISPAFVNRYIKNIIVTPIDQKTMKLDIQLFTGEHLEKQLIRSGHMVNFMCPGRTTVIIRTDRNSNGHKKEYTIHYCITL